MRTSSLDQPHLGRGGGMTRKGEADPQLHGEVEGPRALTRQGWAGAGGRAAEGATA